MRRPTQAECKRTLDWWQGRHVYAALRIETVAGLAVPARAEVLLTGKRNGFQIRAAEACPHCGTQAYVSGVSPFDLLIGEPREGKPR